MNTRRIGNFSLTWGESLRWDDQRGRLYFVDCMKQQLHWLDAGLDRTIEAGVEQPSDVTFGGPALDRLFVVNIAVDIGIGPVASPMAGALLAIDGTGAVGVPENRFRI